MCRSRSSSRSRIGRCTGKGYQDQASHKERVREAIRSNLPDLVTEKSIILSDGLGADPQPGRISFHV